MLNQEGLITVEVVVQEEMAFLDEEDFECLFTYYRFYPICANLGSAICHLFIVTFVTNEPASRSK